MNLRRNAKQLPVIQKYLIALAVTVRCTKLIITIWDDIM